MQGMPTSTTPDIAEAREQAACDWIGNPANYYSPFLVNMLLNITATDEFKRCFDNSDNGKLSSKQAWVAFQQNLAAANVDHDSELYKALVTWVDTVVDIHVGIENQKGELQITATVAQASTLNKKANDAMPQVYQHTLFALTQLFSAELTEDTKTLIHLTIAHHSNFLDNTNLNHGALKIARRWGIQRFTGVKKLTEQERLIAIWKMASIDSEGQESSPFAKTIDNMIATSVWNSALLQAKLDGRLALFIEGIKRQDGQPIATFPVSRSGNVVVTIPKPKPLPVPQPKTIQYRYPRIVEHRQLIWGALFIGSGAVLLAEMLGFLTLGHTAIMLFVPITLIAFAILTFSIRYPLQLTPITYQPSMPPPLSAVSRPALATTPSPAQTQPTASSTATLASVSKT